MEDDDFDPVDSEYIAPADPFDGEDIARFEAWCERQRLARDPKDYPLDALEVGPPAAQRRQPEDPVSRWADANARLDRALREDLDRRRDAVPEPVAAFRLGYEPWYARLAEVHLCRHLDCACCGLFTWDHLFRLQESVRVLAVRIPPHLYGLLEEAIAAMDRRTEELLCRVSLWHEQELDSLEKEYGSLLACPRRRAFPYVPVRPFEPNVLDAWDELLRLAGQALQRGKGLRRLVAYGHALGEFAYRAYVCRGSDVLPGIAALARAGCALPRQSLPPVRRPEPGMIRSREEIDAAFDQEMRSRLAAGEPVHDMFVGMAAAIRAEFETSLRGGPRAEGSVAAQQPAVVVQDSGGPEGYLGLRVNEQDRSVRRTGWEQTRRLRPKEFAVLQVLLRFGSSYRDRSYILRHAWDGRKRTPGTFYATLSRLEKNLEAAFGVTIGNEHGVGYRLEELHPPDPQ
jgi:hypothetical protein